MSVKSQSFLHSAGGRCKNLSSDEVRFLLGGRERESEVESSRVVVAVVNEVPCLALAVNC